MSQPAPIVIGGAFSSPYSLKMRAVLRYRRIPHRWVLRNSRWDDLPDPPVPVIPVLAFPDAEAQREALAEAQFEAKLLAGALQLAPSGGDEESSGGKTKKPKLKVFRHSPSPIRTT